MDLLKELEGAKKIGISGHVRPDGDCVGSCLAMYNYLLNAMEGVELTLFLQPPANVFSFMKNFDNFTNKFELGKNTAVQITLNIVWNTAIHCT